MKEYKVFENDMNFLYRLGSYREWKNPDLVA
jgi:hypothetical protein